MKQKLSAVIVTWNSADLVPAILKTADALKGVCDIVISDNSSEDGTAEMLEDALPEATVLRNPRNGGFGYGNNRALEVCNTEFVLLLNPDARLGPDSALELLRVLEEDPGAAGVQPVVRFWDWPLITLSAGCAVTEFGEGYDLDFLHFRPHYRSDPFADFSLKG